MGGSDRAVGILEWFDIDATGQEKIGHPERIPIEVVKVLWQLINDSPHQGNHVSRYFQPLFHTSRLAEITIA